MKKILFPITVALAIFTAQARADDTNNKEIVIGVAGPFTGGAAPYGTRIKEAAEVWASANHEILGRPVNVIEGDDAADNKQAPSVARYFAVRHVVAVVGHGFSATTIPAAGVYEEEHIMLFGIANGDKLTGKGTANPSSPYVVRMLPSNYDYAVRVAAAIVKAAQSETGGIYFVHDGGDYGKGMVDDVLSLMPPELKARITVQGELDRNTKDFSALVDRMRAADAKLVLLGINQAQAGEIVQQAGKSGFHPDYFGHSLLTQPDFPGIAGADAEKVTVIASPGSDAEKLGADPVYRDMTGAFAAQKKEFSDVGMLVYNSLNVAKEAMIRAQSTDPDAMSKVLHSQSFKIPGAVMRFDERGDWIDAPLVTYKWFKDDKGYKLREIAP